MGIGNATSCILLQSLDLRGCKDPGNRGVWVAQSGKPLTLGFGSGHDLSRFLSSSPVLGSAWAAGEPAWDSLSPSPSARPLLVLSLSLSK